MKVMITDHEHIYGAIEDTPSGLALTGDVEHLQKTIVNAYRTRYLPGLGRSLRDAELVCSLPERVGSSCRAATL